jgi:type II secretory pathway pseudopilin PulG
MFRRFHARISGDEAGIGLVELLIVITILGILGSAMTMVTFIGMRSYRQTAKEQSAQSAIQGVGFYLPADVRSAAPANVIANGGSGACGLSGASLAQITWTDLGVNYASLYRITGDTLSRTYCAAGGSALTTTLGNGVSGSASVTSGALTLVLSSTASPGTSARELYRIVARTRADGGGGPGPGACAGTLGLSPSSVARGSGNRLTSAVLLTFTVTSGTCASPTFVVPNNSNANGTFAGPSPTFTATIPTSVNGWNGPLPQDFAINVIVGGITVATATLVVT